MPRGKASAIGDTRIAANGYHYTKAEKGWRLTHHIIAEREILGRPLRENERVEFIDGRTLLDASNIRVTVQGRGSLRRRKAQLEERIRELSAELALVEAELAK